MKYPTLLTCLMAVALAACTTQTPAPPPPPPTVQASLDEAETALRANQRDKALAVLKQAAANHPTKAEPLLRAAQMHYDRNEYGEAITWARKALEREPANVLAHSIVTVSGLRVVTKSLNDLADRNLTGEARDEAEGLAKLLRTALKEDGPLVPVKNVPARSAPAPSKKGRKAPADDPFSALK
ncbi:hypothetical protein [Pseudoduganella sp. GCM10020061]|uniref:hypothetical protein n=1 Tax=Pseudoduganella sp. GCM10020061 TaxID=3317345 RepID=UPI0036393849